MLDYTCNLDSKRQELKAFEEKKTSTTFVRPVAIVERLTLRLSIVTSLLCAPHYSASPSYSSMHPSPLELSANMRESFLTYAPISLHPRNTIWRDFMRTFGHPHRSRIRKRMGSLSDALPVELSWQDGGVLRYPSQVSQSAPSLDSVQIINQMSTTQGIDQGPYIPNDDCFWRPFYPNLKVLSEGNMVIQELQ